MADPCIPLYEPATRLTGRPTATITAGTFVNVSATLPSPALGTDSTGGNIPIATCAAGARALGVAESDGVNGGPKIGVLCGPGMVVPMTADGAVTFAQEVEVGTAGKPKTWGGTVGTARVGKALSTAADGAVVYIRLYT